MKKVYVFLADGFETVEALAVVDILRRASIEAVTVAVSDCKKIISAQKIEVNADVLISDVDVSDADVVFLPGGMPGTRNLEADATVTDIVKRQYATGKIVAAICAAPSILGHLSMLEGKKATCYTGFEKDLYGAVYTGARVERDGNVVTGKGMGTAIDMGLELVELLIDKETAEKIAHGIQYR